MTEAAKEVVKISWGTLMQGSLILATVLLSFAYVKARSDMNTRDIVAHKIDDKEQWNKAFDLIDDNEKNINMIKLQNTRIESNQKEILRRIDLNDASGEKRHQEFMNFIKNFEVID